MKATGAGRVLGNLGVTVAAMLCAMGGCRAGWFDIALNHRAVDARGGTFVGEDPSGRMALGGRIFHDDDRDATLGAFLAGFTTDASAAQGLEISLGIEGFLGRAEHRDVDAVALGFEVAWAPVRARGGFVGGRLYYAPKILSWRDTESLLDWSLRGGYRITPKIFVLAEFEGIHADFEGQGGRTIGRDALFGFGARF